MEEDASTARVVEGSGAEITGSSASMEPQPPPPPPPPAALASPPVPASTAIAQAGVEAAPGTDSSLVLDNETRAAVADLIATNRKLRRAVKERDAERATLRSSMD